MAQRDNRKDQLAKQRQQEYNEYLARRRGAPMRGPPGAAAPPPYQHQPHVDDAPHGPERHAGGMGLQFGEEVQPRPFGHGGMANMYGGADAEQQRRHKMENRKKEYAAELERQIAEKQRRKQAEKSANRRQANQAVGMGNLIRDMRDGLRDGVGDGMNMYGAVNAYQDVPYGGRGSHPNQDGDAGAGPYGDDERGGDQGGFDANERMAPRQQQQGRQPPQQPQQQPPPRQHQGGAWNPGPQNNQGHWMHGIANVQGREVSQEQYDAAARKKAEYQRALEEQIREKAERKAREKRAQEERELREEREAAEYNPWGKAGGGAPVRDDRGHVVTNLKDMHNDANDRRDNADAFRSPPRREPPRRPETPPNERAGGGLYQSPRVHNFRSDKSNMLPHEVEQKQRAQEELQNALAQQIEEKKRRKEAEIAREKAEAVAEEQRLAAQQQRLREAFEKEQAAEKAKAAERLAAEEEAYNLAASKRKEQERRDRGERTPEPPSLQERLDNNAQRPEYMNQPPPNWNQQQQPRTPPPPRGPTPAGAKELQMLRDELQAEHAELMRAMKDQNEHMAMLQRRAEMAEKHSAEARVELAEMRENLSDQVFLSSLPSVGGPGAGIVKGGGAKFPMGRPRSGRTILNGPPHVSPSDDYGVFMRDGLEPLWGAGGEANQDMGPALDGGVGRGFAGGGDVGQSLDLGASMTAESSFIFPGQTLARAPFLGGHERPGGGDGVQGGATRQASKPPLGRPRSSGRPDSGFGDPGPREAYHPPDTAATQASDSLNEIHKKSEARLRALERGMGRGAGAGGNSDVDQLDQLLKDFLAATRGGTPLHDQAAPLLEDDDMGPALDGVHAPGVVGPGYRPDTQASMMSMEADTRFIRH